MDARHLALLRDLRDRGSVQAVATASQRTPSAVSQQLRTAQRDLKIKLVEPEGRGLRLTPAGELLAECAGDARLRWHAPRRVLMSFSNAQVER